MALNLKQWLAGLFGLMLVLALAQGGLALVKLDAVAARTTLLLDDTIPSVNAAHGINATIIRTRLWQFRYVTAESDTARAESLAKVAEFANDRNGQIELYRARVSSAAEQKVYDDLLAKLALLKPDWDRLRAFPAERHDEAMAFFRGPMNANYLAVSGAARALVDVNLAAARTADAEVRAEQASATRATLLMLGVAVLIALGAMAFCFLGVSRPIERMTGAMRRLAGGDTDSEIPYGGRRDEIGAMAGAVQVFRENLVRTRALEAETALARASAEEQRRAGMRQMADGFEHAVGGIVGMVSSAASELQATAQGMSATAGQTAGSVQQRRGGRRPGGLQRQHRGGGGGGTRLVGGRDRPAGLGLGRPRPGRGGGGRRHGRPRAGSGPGRQPHRRRGGADLADRRPDQPLGAQRHHRGGARRRGGARLRGGGREVKELAAQTARATEEISTQIGRIQGSTDQAVGAIGGIGTRIREISGVAAQIAAAVEEQGAATQEIVRNVAQASTGTSEVTVNIAGVAGAAEETGAAAAQVLASASELSRQSEHLSAEVQRFLATVRAA